ncbi:hypothetical protein LSAT2_002260 [Lamellibrachia satsuma]|nr:hypothetical protein LSAT2_002260 [Lamellibrachia satsuma]
MLVGGILTDHDVSMQYMSPVSNVFKSYIVNPVLTQNKTDRYLRNRIYDWEGNMMFITTIPDQTIEGPLSITMPFDKNRVRNFMTENMSARILRWCAGFDGYKCKCRVGYTGLHCETEINECLSSPCLQHYSCVDRVGSYVCKCEPGSPCNPAPLLKTWHIGLITGLAIGILLLFVCLAEIYFFNFRKRCCRFGIMLSVLTNVV